MLSNKIKCPLLLTESLLVPVITGLCIRCLALMFLGSLPTHDRCSF